MSFNNVTYKFQTLRTSEFNASKPLLFIKHPVAIVSVDKPGIYTIKLKPDTNGKALFNLKSVILQPVL